MSCKAAQVYVYLARDPFESDPVKGTIFAYRPGPDLPKGLKVERGGDIEFKSSDDNADIEKIRLQFILKTDSLKWGDVEYKANFRADNMKKPEDVLWISKDNAKPDAESGGSNRTVFDEYSYEPKTYCSNKPSKAVDVVEVTLHPRDSKFEAHEYALAVALHGASSELIVRDDPQIKNTGIGNREIGGLTPAVLVAFLVGGILAAALAWLRWRR